MWDAEKLTDFCHPRHTALQKYTPKMHKVQVQSMQNKVKRVLLIDLNMPTATCFIFVCVCVCVRQLGAGVGTGRDGIKGR